MTGIVYIQQFENINMNREEYLKYKKMYYNTHKNQWINYYQSHKNQPDFKEKKKINGLKRITFMGKRIQIKNIIRIGECSECNKKGYTHLHHEKYNESNPLNHTVELCPSCHAHKTWKQRKGVN